MNVSKPWFRLYAEFSSDPKMQLLAFEDQRHYIAVLCLKCSGVLDTLSVGPEHFERMVAKALGLDPVTGAEVKRRLIEVGIILESWQPVAWDKRQYESDSSASRTHKWRQRKSQERHSDVTVTDKIRSEQNISEQREIRGAAARAIPTGSLAAQPIQEVLQRMKAKIQQ